MHVRWESAGHTTTKFISSFTTVGATLENKKGLQKVSKVIMCLERREEDNMHSQKLPKKEAPLPRYGNAATAQTQGLEPNLSSRIQGTVGKTATTPTHTL